MDISNDYGDEIIATSLLLDAGELLASVMAATVLVQALYSHVDLITEATLVHSLPPVLQLIVRDQLPVGGKGQVAVVANDDVLPLSTSKK